MSNQLPIRGNGGLTLISFKDVSDIAPSFNRMLMILGVNSINVMILVPLFSEGNSKNTLKFFEDKIDKDTLNALIKLVPVIQAEFLEKFEGTSLVFLNIGQEFKKDMEIKDTLNIDGSKELLNAAYFEEIQHRETFLQKMGIIEIKEL